MTVRCDLIHDRVYVEALDALADAAYGLVAPSQRERVHNKAELTIYERRVLHNAGHEDFCESAVCAQRGTVNRWSERAQRGW
ncbi:MAG: hypothetical protein ACRDTT_30900 [Pseudonocardiaceae bacterium]